MNNYSKICTYPMLNEQLFSHFRFDCILGCFEKSRYGLPCQVKCFTHFQGTVTPRIRRRRLSYLNGIMLTLTRFCQKKIRAPRKNNTVVFIAFSENSTSRKTPFFPVGRNFEDRKSKKSQKSLIGGPPTPKSFWENFRSKNMGQPEISARGLLITILGLFFEKTILWLTGKNNFFF